MNERSRKPVLALCAVLLPLIGALGAYVAADRTPGLAAIGVLFVLTIIGIALGAVAALLAMWRRERWFGLQAAALLINAGLLLWAASHSFGPPPRETAPQGERAYLMLAPPASRTDDVHIRLAYAAPPAGDAAGYVIGRRDERGIVRSIRAASLQTALGPNELRMQLNVDGGRWAIRRDGTYIRHLPAGRWKTATFMELKVFPSGWAGPVDAIDDEPPPGPPR